MRLCGSGNMIGSSQGPCTMNGSSKPGTAALARARGHRQQARGSLRDRVRAPESMPSPVSASRPLGPSMRTSSTFATPWVIFRLTVKRLVGRLAAAELAAARKRPPLDAPEQLLDIEAGDRALAAGEAGRSVQCLGQLVDAAAGAVDREAEIALALELSNAEHLAEALLEIDIGELQLRLEVGAGRRFREPERALDHAAEGLRLADRHRQLAAAQIGCDRSSPELGIRRS